jgi:hypothetical protein
MAWYLVCSTESVIKWQEFAVILQIYYTSASLKSSLQPDFGPGQVVKSDVCLLQ